MIEEITEHKPVTGYKDVTYYAQNGYRILAVDSQIVSTISLCEMKANLKFMHNYELVGEDKADYLDRGDLMHTCLKVYYTLKKRTDRFNFNDRVEIAIQIARKKATTMDISVIESEEYIDVFKQYADYFKAEAWIPVEVEQPFTVILYVNDELKLVFLYEGVIDLIIEGYGGPKFQIVDHKGTKRRYEPIDMTFQFLGYCWALGYNTLTAQQVGFQKTLAPEKKFLRHTYSYTQSNLEEWRVNTIKHLLRWVQAVDSNDFLLDYNGIACTAYNRICPYYKYFCKASPDAREWNLQTKYTIRKPWSPWTRDEEIDKFLAHLMA